MIVVLGCPAAQSVEGVVRPAGLAGWIATAAADADAQVQLVGRIGDDRAGDAVVLALARGRVGHAALLRDPARPTPQIQLDDAWSEDVASDEPPSSPSAPAAGPSLDPEDVALGLRYLTAFSVLVIADPLEPSATAAALDAAAFAGARTIAVVAAGPPAVAEATAITAAAAIAADDVFVAPDGDPPAFAAMVGRYAASIDAGREPGDALRTATTVTGWAPALDEAAGSNPGR